MSLRLTPRFRQEEQPAPTFKEKVGPTDYGDSFYERVGKPGSRNQILVSRVTFIIYSPTLYL